MTGTRRSVPSGRWSAGLPSATRPSAGRALSLILACASAGRGPAAGFLEAAALLARSFSRRPATAATALSEAGDFTGLPEWAAGRFLCAVWGFCRLGGGRGGEEGRSPWAPDHLKKKK